MPAPRDVGCPLCGKRFFRHSLPIHLPQCQKKRSSLEIPCPNCDELVRGDDIAAHRRRCKLAKRRFRGGATSFGDSSGGGCCNNISIAFAPGSPARSPQPFTKTGTPITSKRAARARAPAAAAEAVDLDMAPPCGDGRLRCAVCARGFAADRLAVHQKICRASAARGRNVFDAPALRRQRLCESNGVASLPPPARQRPW